MPKCRDNYRAKKRRRAKIRELRFQRIWNMACKSRRAELCREAVKLQRIGCSVAAFRVEVVYEPAKAAFLMVMIDRWGPTNMKVFSRQICVVKHNSEQEREDVFREHVNDGQKALMRTRAESNSYFDSESIRKFAKEIETEMEQTLPPACPAGQPGEGSSGDESVQFPMRSEP